jgi:hypothetical protein
MLQHNAGAEFKNVYDQIVAVFTAGTADNNKNQVGEIIDRRGFNSCQLALQYDGAIGSNKKMLYSVNIADSSNGEDWNDPVDLLVSEAIVSLVTGASVKGCYNLNINLSPYDSYIEIGKIVELTNTTTDTMKYNTVLSLGGGNVVPADTSILNV